MWRRILVDMQTWYDQPGKIGNDERKPLVLRGARQVGKTWLVRELARQTKANIVELNFERDHALADLFHDNDPKQTITNIDGYLSTTITSENTILFLDEVQAAPEILAKLRWFAEEMPSLAIVATGSLLDFALADYAYSMPVGRISYMHVEPMSFEEFLHAMGEKQLLNIMKELHADSPAAAPIHQKLIDLARTYRFVGGMPAAVKSYVHSQKETRVSSIHSDLLATFQDDFHKYAKRVPHQRLTVVLDSIAHQLGHKFKYRNVEVDAPTAPLKRALSLLAEARLCHQIYASAANALPLSGERRDRYFKTFLLDIGLVSSLLGITSLTNKPLSNEGSMSEQYVAQQLRCNFPRYVDPSLFYWCREKTGSEAEVDFVIAHNGNMIPVEVKSGKAGTLRSLHLFMATKPAPLALRIDSNPMSLMRIQKPSLVTGDSYLLLSIPFYLIEQLPRLIDETLI